MGALAICFDAFSSREPIPTSLENALFTPGRCHDLVRGWARSGYSNQLGEPARLPRSVRFFDNDTAICREPKRDPASRAEPEMIPDGLGNGHLPFTCHGGCHDVSSKVIPLEHRVLPDELSTFVDG
jgi:hypothetical protein